MMNMMKRIMKIQHSCLLAALVLLTAGMVSCKKDDDSETEILPELTGTLNYELPSYVMAGQVFELVPTGVSKDKDGLPGIYWVVSTNSSVRDTTRYENGTGTGAYTLVIPDDITTMTVTCYAFAEGYYNTSKAVTVTRVKGAESITGLNLPEDVAQFSDPRDGRSYPYVKIGSREWMVRNLAYGTAPAYMEAVAMQDVFGLFYYWDEAVSACPEGWRLPDADDLKDLATAHGCADTEDVYAGIGGKLMADAYMNDMKMWEFWPDVKITNNLRFCAIPTGYALDADGSYTFKGSSHYAVFWTAEENGEEQAWCRQLYVKSNDVYKASMYKSAFRAPVRCVRTAE